MSYFFQRRVLSLLVAAGLGVLLTTEVAWAQKCGKSGGMTGTPMQFGMRSPGRQTPNFQTPYQQTGLTNPYGITPAQLQNLLQQQQLQFLTLLQQSAQAQALLQQRVLQLQMMLQQIQYNQTGAYAQYTQPAGNLLRQQLSQTQLMLKQAKAGDDSNSGE